MPLIRTEDDEQGRLCRVESVLPEVRWRQQNVPEYRVQLVALPATAILREDDLQVISRDASDSSDATRRASPL